MPFQWLMDRTDPASGFEREFLDNLRRDRRRLPDLAQHQPADDVMVQTDFYYERDGRPGICIFIDGPHHDEPKQKARDREVRAALEDRGFRVVAIVHNEGIEEQIRTGSRYFR